MCVCVCVRGGGGGGGVIDCRTIHVRIKRSTCINPPGHHRDTHCHGGWRVSEICFASIKLVLVLSWIMCICRLKALNGAHQLALAAKHHSIPVSLHCGCCAVSMCVCVWGGGGGMLHMRLFSSKTQSLQLEERGLDSIHHNFSWGGPIPTIQTFFYSLQ